MEYIHNKPKGSEGPRMPLILPEGLEKKWLMPINDKIDQEEIQELIRPLDESLLDYHTVSRLKGRVVSGIHVRPSNIFPMLNCLSVDPVYRVENRAEMSIKKLRREPSILLDFPAFILL
jgi:hypothetical protein